MASAPNSEYPGSREPVAPSLPSLAGWRDRTDDEQVPWDPYYYFGMPDRDSPDDFYDPTRECFHIDVAPMMDSEPEEGDVGRVQGTPPLGAVEGEVQSRHDDDAHATQMAQLHEMQRKLDEERGRLRDLERAFKQEREQRGEGARVNTNRSLRMGFTNALSSTTLARTSSPPPCSCVAYPNPRPLK